MTNFYTFASGSSGNALLLSCDDTHLLIDAGISLRRIKTSLKALGLSMEDLSAILITHTHSDHTGALATTVRHHDLPIFASEIAARELQYRVQGITPLLRPFAIGQELHFGDCRVRTFPTAHDAPGSVCYRIDTPDGSFGILTDSGFVTEEAQELLPGVDLLVLEANHDVETLLSGPYPYYLKDRILGSRGHLSNDAAAEFAVKAAKAGTKEIILAHLSRENNTPAMAYNAVFQALCCCGCSTVLSVAPRETMSECHRLEGSCLCRK